MHLCARSWCQWNTKRSVLGSETMGYRRGAIVGCFVHVCEEKKAHDPSHHHPRVPRTLCGACECNPLPFKGGTDTHTSMCVSDHTWSENSPVLCPAWVPGSMNPRVKTSADPSIVWFRFVVVISTLSSACGLESLLSGDAT